jgi:hypothetical protein
MKACQLTRTKIQQQKKFKIILVIDHLLISNSNITQEWPLIVNTAMTENQRFLRHKLTLHILQI